jgi:hypothetical protein
VSLWPWRIHWIPQYARTLEEACRAHGTDVWVEISIDVLESGSLHPPLQVEARCTAAEILLDLPSRFTFHGVRQIVDRSTGNKAPPLFIVGDVHCSRDVFFVI